jgi:hypothetical protein
MVVCHFNLKLKCSIYTARRLFRRFQWHMILQSLHRKNILSQKTYRVTHMINFSNMIYYIFNTLVHWYTPMEHKKHVCIIFLQPTQVCCRFWLSASTISAPIFFLHRQMKERVQVRNDVSGTLSWLLLFFFFQIAGVY